jgi:hypothetical protein
LISLEPGSSFFDSAFLHQVLWLESHLASLNGTNYIRSPLSLPYLIDSPLGIQSLPLIHVDQPEVYQKDSLRIVQSDFHRAFFHEFKAATLYLKHRHFTSPDSAQRYLDKVNRLVNSVDCRHQWITGKLPAEQTFIALIKKDFGGYLVLSLVVSCLIGALIFRSLKYLGLLLLVSISSLITTLGIMAMTGIPISIMTVLLPPILLFTSTSDAIHLIHARKHAANLERAIRKVFLPTLITSVTTMIGFLSLYWINVTPVRDFGIYAALGVGLAFVLNYLLLPKFLHKVAPSKSEKKKAQFIRPFPKPIWILAMLIVALLALAGLHRLQVDAYLLEDLPPEAAIKKAFQEVDDLEVGTKPFLMVAYLDDSTRNWQDPEIQRAIHAANQYLDQEYGVRQLLSLPQLLAYSAQVNATENSPEPPFDKKAFTLAQRIDRRLPQSTLSNHHTSFIGMIPEWGSARTREKDQALANHLQHFSETGLHFRVTGTTYLIDKSHHLLSEKLIYGLLTAILSVAILLGVLYRNLKLVMVALLPNLLSLGIIAGLIGWLGIPLQLSNAIIFSVAFGIIVDDTIHFISGLLNSDPKSSWEQRLIQTRNYTGIAIILTSIVILSGFSLFLFSSFGATFQMGLFMVLSVFIALAIDLYLLPYLIYRFLKPKATASG